MFSFADHEPPSYFFDAKKRNYHSRHVSELDTSKDSVAWEERINSDSDIQKRLDEVMKSEPRVVLAALATSDRKIIYEQQLNA